MERSRTVRIAVVVCVLVVTPCSLVRAKYGGGQGTADEPYLVGTAEQLCAIGADPNDWDRHFRLTADIDLSRRRGAALRPIGSRWGPYGRRPYTGVFDGAGHTILNFSYTSNETYSAGLFGYIADGAELRDLILVNPTVDAPAANVAVALTAMLAWDSTITGCSVQNGNVLGKGKAGGLAGMGSGTLLNCSFAGEVTGGPVVGGLVGHVEDATITGCHTEATVTGRNSVGGLVGWSQRGDLKACHSAGTVVGEYAIGGLLGSNGGTLISSYSTATVRGTDERAGGFVGSNSGTIISCWASGSVEGNEYVGGFVGMGGGAISHSYATGAALGQTLVGGFSGTNGGRIMFCYSTGTVSGDENVAGFAPGGSTFLCYWDTEASGIAQGGAGWGRTTRKMQTAATFAGWGYESRWRLAEGADYPRLIWERAGGQLLVDAPRGYAGGTGEPNAPYLIATAEQLVLIARYLEDFDKHFRLVDDINLLSVAAEDVMPIGVGGAVFSGSFAGGGHAIRYFTCRAPGQDSVGFFGTVGPNGSVRGLCLMNATVSSRYRAAALIGHNAGSVHDCFVTGTVEGLDYVGGLVGYNEGQIEASDVHAQVTGQSSVGGLTGYNKGQVETCGVFGRVTGKSSVGGLVGRNDKDIFASHSVASVSGEEEVGGLVGTGGRAQTWQICPAPPPSYVPGLSDSRITGCYCTGSVVGQAGLGGLVGQNSGVVLECYATCPVRKLLDPTGTGSTVDVGTGGLVGVNDYGIVCLSYWDIELSGLSYSAGGQGRVSSQMVRADTFRGWEHTGLWVIDDGSDYPRLAWERTFGAPIVADPFRYGGGTGLSDDPYQIWTAEEFVNIGYHPADWDKYFVLMDDLDLGDVDANAVRPVGILSLPFSGTFDGQGFTIANFTCLRDLELYTGLFGSIGAGSVRFPRPGGAVSNLNLTGVDVAGFSKVGGLAGHNASTISSCSVTGRIVAHGKNAGGLVGYNVGTLADCVVDCNVTAEEVAGSLAAYSRGPAIGCSGAGVVTTVGPRDSYAGGLIGENADVVRDSHFVGQVVGQYTAGGLVALNEGTIQHCSAHAAISGTYLLGGLVGYNEYDRVVEESFAESMIVGGNSVGGLAGFSNGQIRNCFASGQLTGEARVGGLVGQCQRELAFCYSTCAVSGQDTVGGLVGEVRWGEITSCFWDVELSGSCDGVANAEPDPVGAIGMMTPALKMQSTFTAAGWDFVGESENGTDDVWFIEEGLDYPRLAVETVSETSDHDDTGGPARSR